MEVLRTCALTVPSDDPTELLSNHKGAFDAHHVRAQIELELGGVECGPRSKISCLFLVEESRVTIEGGGDHQR